jgi:subtilisin
MLSQATATRRGILRTIGLGVAGLTVAGNVSAGEGRFIVGTRTRAARREAQRRARHVHRTLDFGRYGSAVAGQFSEQALRGLSRRPDVDYIEEDGKMYAIGGVADIDSTDAEVEWGVDRIDAEKAHAGGHTGVGAKIAILDTGIDYTHPDLGNYVGGYDFVNGDSDPMDDHGHGTHCAGIAAASSGDGGVVGVAPDASLYGVKVLDSQGSGYYSDIAAGLEWTHTNQTDGQMHVASMSLGGGRGSTTLERACNAAADSGVFVVAAAGNDGRNRVSYPAKYPSVVAVSATDDADGLAWFSNRGDEIELAAPGVAINSTVPGADYESWSGTSMACPHVAGVAALVMADGTSGGDARSRLQQTAEDLGSPGWDNKYGYGLVDAEAAVGSGGGGGTGDTTAPSAPANLTATGKTDSSVDLSWGASSDDTSVDHYDVYVDGVATLQTAGTTATVDGLAPETAYEFYVTATDGAGNESGASDTISVTTHASSSGGTVPSIDSFSVVSGSPNNPHADIEMSWQVSGSPDTVTLELYEGSDASGSLIQTWNVSSSGTQSYQEKFTSGTYTARLVATNASGSVDATGTVTA